MKRVGPVVGGTPDGEAGSFLGRKIATWQSDSPIELDCRIAFVAMRFASSAALIFLRVEHGERMDGLAGAAHPRSGMPNDGQRQAWGDCTAGGRHVAAIANLASPANSGRSGEPLA